MTIEKLLGYSTQDLAKLSDEELLRIFEPYLKASRLEMIGKVHDTSKPISKSIKKKDGPTKDEVSAARDKANEMAKAMGLKPIF